ncbi:MAG: molybdenum ABC transporter ATP-binding protein [Gammaproteobacteria bacterium]|nr:molybdenum ABC transporter ATP-binding protein [Gammaproteobacteria bacterium]
MSDTLAIDVTLDREAFRLDVDASLPLTGITAVFGPSGSGKTSLLRVIAGLEPAATGGLRFRSEDWQPAGHSPVPPESRAIGFVFQDGRLFPHLNVRGNLSYPLRHGQRSGPIELDELVATLGLEPLLERYPESLSGGERQRVAIARALLANPVLMLMDEPLSSLDSKRKRELLPLIKDLPSRYRIPVVYVTHNVDELVYLADDVLLLKAGRCIAQAATRDIIDHPEFAELAELDDPGSVVEASVREHSKTLTLAAIGSQILRVPRIEAAIDAPLRLRIHARDVILATEKPAHLSIRNCLEGQLVQLAKRDGGQVDAIVKVGTTRIAARITQDAADELALVPGQRVYALIKTVALEGLAS